VLRIGRTAIVFRAPGVGFESTHFADAAPPARLTDTERRVLVALCAPFAGASGPAPAPAPATNRDIAAGLNISLDSVKKHVRSLFDKLGVGDLPLQYQKRTELAHRALEGG